MGNEKNKSRIFAGLMLVGLGILAITNYWWPGIMFVIGITMVISGIYHGKSLYDFVGAAVLIFIGALSAAEGNIDHEILKWWPAVLIVFGCGLLFYRLAERKK